MAAWLALAAALALAGCAAARPGTLHIEGRLDGHAAGSPGAPLDWVVELRDDTAQRVLGEQRGTLAAQQPPVRFQLTVDAARVDRSHRHSVRGALLARGSVKWLSEPRPVDLSQPRSDAGSLRLRPYSDPGGFASTLDCGGRQLVAGHVGERLRLSEGALAIELELLPGREPSRFERAGDPGTFVELDERGATVSLQGTVLPRCTAMPR